MKEFIGALEELSQMEMKEKQDIPLSNEEALLEAENP